jgi:hypothetical protein
MNSGAGNKVPGWLYLLIILSVILMWVFFTSFKVKDSTLGSSPNQTVSFPQKPTEYSVQTLPTLSVGSAIRYNSSAVSPKEDFGCPSGCTYHKDGCDIKGNVSFETKEKIYHIPGQEFYSETVISTRYGERWFCTEKEAVESGWRNAYK